MNTEHWLTLQNPVSKFAHNAPYPLFPFAFYYSSLISCHATVIISIRWHPTVSFFFLIASCLTSSPQTPSLLSSLLFFLSRPSPSFLSHCELTLRKGALINEGPCPAMIAGMGWHHVTQSFLHIAEGKGRTPPDSSITVQTYWGVQ